MAAESSWLGWLQQAVGLGGGAGEGQADAPALQRDGMLSKEKLMEFMEACVKLYSNPEVKSKLAEAAKTGKVVEDQVNKLQTKLFESIGVDGRFGLACLARVTTVYKDDRELLTKFMQFVAIEELICDEAEKGPEYVRQKMQQAQARVQQGGFQRQGGITQAHPG
eukprot:jgi/Chlat1/2750/Chrsp187S02937